MLSNTSRGTGAFHSNRQLQAFKIGPVRERGVLGFAGRFCPRVCMFVFSLITRHGLELIELAGQITPQFAVFRQQPGEQVLVGDGTFLSIDSGA